MGTEDHDFRRYRAARIDLADPRAWRDGGIARRAAELSDEQVDEILARAALDRKARHAKAREDRIVEAKRHEGPKAKRARG